MEIKESHNAENRRNFIYVSGTTAITRQPSFLTNLRILNKSALTASRLYIDEIASVINDEEIVSYINNRNTINSIDNSDSFPKEKTV